MTVRFPQDTYLLIYGSGAHIKSRLLTADREEVQRHYDNLHIAFTPIKGAEDFPVKECNEMCGIFKWGRDQWERA